MRYGTCMIGIGLITALFTGVGLGQHDRAEEILLQAPFEAQRANFFYAALGVPRLETAFPLPPGETYLRLRTDHSHSEKGPRVSGDAVQEGFRTGNLTPDSFLGLYHTWAALEVTHGITRWLDIGARAGFGGWDEHTDHFYFFSEDGQPLVRFEALDIAAIGPSGRDDSIADAVVKAKVLLWQREEQHALALAGQAKLPLGSSRDLNHAGTTDVGLRLLGTTAHGPWALHANAGVVWPLGDQEIFVESARVDLDPFVAGGLGVVYAWSETLSLGLQLEGNTSAFGDVDFLDGDPLTVLGGVRKLWHGFIFEGGAGTGFDHGDSYQWSTFLSVARVF